MQTDPNAPTAAPEPAPPPLVMLHGFAQTGRCLGPLAEELADDRTVLTPDLPGHGRATTGDDLDCGAAADALLAECGPGDWLGYSLGGRIALHVAVRNPGAVDRLVLVSSTAGVDDPASRAARLALDRQRADRVEADGVDRFLAQWLAMPMFSALAPWARFAEERATNTAAGLAGSLRNCGTGSMRPLWDRLDRLDMPVLLVAGSLDRAYVELAHRLAAGIGDNARVAIIDGAHHAAHLEQPAAVIEVVRSFLERVNRAAGRP